VRQSIGILAGAGHNLDDILDMSFQQIALVSGCIVEVKVDALNAIVGPIMGGLGKEYKPAEKGKRKRSGEHSQKDRAQRDENKLLGLASLGIPVG
jgi:hypothetical protein